jgi:hypothetical protein
MQNCGNGVEIFVDGYGPREKGDGGDNEDARKPGSDDIVVSDCVQVRFGVGECSFDKWSEWDYEAGDGKSWEIRARHFDRNVVLDCCLSYIFFFARKHS